MLPGGKWPAFTSDIASRNAPMPATIRSAPPQTGAACACRAGAGNAVTMRMTPIDARVAVARKISEAMGHSGRVSIALTLRLVRSDHGSRSAGRRLPFLIEIVPCHLGTSNIGEPSVRVASGRKKSAVGARIHKGCHTRAPGRAEKHWRDARSVSNGRDSGCLLKVGHEVVGQLPSSRTEAIATPEKPPQTA